MEQFNLDKWLQDKSRKICTRDGRPVRIVCWDVKSISPIIGIIQDRLGGEFARNYALNGKYSTQNETEYDLFFADEEKTNKILDELKSYLENTPKEQVEKDWKEIQDWYSQHFTNEKCNKEEGLTEFEKELQTIISKASYWISDDGSISTYCQFGDKEIKKISAQIIDLARKKDWREPVGAYKNGYEQGKQEALKDFPKWRRDCFHNITSVVDGRLYYNDYYIDINELEKLQKEK